MSKLKGAIAVFVGAASFGILSTFVKKAYGLGFSLGEVTGIQAFLGMVILWSLNLIFVKKNQSSSYTQLSKKWIILLAGFSTGAVSILYYKTVSLVPASIAIVLLMQFIWISGLLNFLLFKQKPTWVESIGIVCILGATLLATGVFEDSFNSVSPLGIIYGLLSATAYALFIIVNGKVGNDHPPLRKSALMVTGAFIFVMVVIRPFTLLNIEDNIPLYEYGFLLALFGTILPPVLFSYGMPKVGVSVGSIISAVELPVAVSMSYFVLHESVSSKQWLGVLLILLCMVFINLLKKKST